MKLTNKNNSNIYDVDTYVMRGTISMSKDEWKEVLMFLEKEYKKAVKNCDTYIRDSLWNFEKRFENKGKKIFCLGITATQLLVNKYNLQN